jgi:hypothetical protein
MFLLMIKATQNSFNSTEVLGYSMHSYILMEKLQNLS